ncbi:Na+/H+ antiporter subunit E [Nesterenkonia populi]|uniref:Na+/H+ antiporter subunit E n=1 Tax=Nesterenkonia populi TaxID=1591087 RepID=UPI0011BF665A|nr:Na+/H+ antiporter subunit E [Nesterenkonia populi]
MSAKNPSSASWPLRFLSFALWYVKEFFLANLQVTMDVLRPKQRMSPAIVAVPAASKTDAEWAMISILVTLTPGTMTIAISKEESVLYVHSMFAETRDAAAEEIQEMENRMVRAMRRTPGDLTRPLAPAAAPEGGGDQ